MLDLETRANGNILLLFFFSFPIVKPLMPILALLTIFARPKYETPHRLLYIWTLYTNY